MRLQQRQREGSPARAGRRRGRTSEADATKMSFSSECWGEGSREQRLRRSGKLWWATVDPRFSGGGGASAPSLDPSPETWNEEEES